MSTEPFLIPEIPETPEEQQKDLISVRAVIIFDERGDYVIHADSTASPAAMFKRLTDGPTPLWTFNPASDRAEVIDFTIKATKAIDLPKARVYGTQY